MRADLHQMEQIDLYLQGKMSAAESAAFEAQVAANPQLAEMVAQQQLFAQVVSRKALLAEIQVVAGSAGGAWYANPYVLGGVGLTVVGGIIATVVYLSASDNPETVTAPIVQADPTESGSPVEYSNEVVIAPEDTLEYRPVRNDHISTPVSGPSALDHIIVNDDEPIIDHPVFDEHVESETSGLADEATNSTDRTDKRVRNRKAGFPKGDQAMNVYIDENALYPGTARKEQLQGNVKVKFLVDKEGQKTNIVAECFVLRDENEKLLNATQMILNQRIVKLFEESTVRIVRTMPAWEPATDSQGNPVVSAVQLYFNFSLTDGITAYQLDEHNE